MAGQCSVSALRAGQSQCQKPPHTAHTYPSPLTLSSCDHQTAGQEELIPRLLLAHRGNPGRSHHPVLFPLTIARLLSAPPSIDAPVPSPQGWVGTAGAAPCLLLCALYRLPQLIPLPHANKVFGIAQEPAQHPSEAGEERTLEVHPPARTAVPMSRQLVDADTIHSPDRVPNREYQQNTLVPGESGVCVSSWLCGTCF